MKYAPKKKQPSSLTVMNTIDLNMKTSITSLAKACFRFSSLALVVGGLFTSAQAQNLITNGSFELPAP